MGGSNDHTGTGAIESVKVAGLYIIRLLYSAVEKEPQHRSGLHHELLLSAIWTAEFATAECELDCFVRTARFVTEDDLDCFVLLHVTWTARFATAACDLDCHVLLR